VSERLQIEKIYVCLKIRLLQHSEYNGL